MTALYAVFVGLHAAFCTPLMTLRLTRWTKRILASRSEALDPIQSVNRYLFSHASDRAVVFAILIGLVFVLYLMAYRFARRDEPPSVRSILFVSALFSLMLLPTVPSLSRDLLVYVATGEIADRYAANPYEVPLSDFQRLETPVIASQIEHGSIYGPLAARLFQHLYVARFGDFGNALAFKSFFVICLLVSLWVTADTLQRLGVHERTARSLLLLFAWNPLVLIEVAVNGHVDVLVTLMFALGVNRVAAGRTTFGLAVVLFGCAVKITYLFVLPAIVALIFSLERRRGRAVARVLQVVGLGAAFYTVWLVPDWMGAGPLTSLSIIKGWTMNSLAFVLKHAGREIGIRGPVANSVMGTAFAVVVLAGVWRVRDRAAFLRRFGRDQMLYLLFFSPLLYPWYALPAFPVVIASARRRELSALILFTATAFIGVYFVQMTPTLPRTEAKILSYVLAAVPASVAFLWLSRREIRREGN
jgi:hypothetical protein